MNVRVAFPALVSQISTERQRETDRGRDRENIWYIMMGPFQRKIQTSPLKPQPHTAFQASNHNWLVVINESQKSITQFQAIWRHRQPINTTFSWIPPTDLMTFCTYLYLNKPMQSAFLHAGWLSGVQTILRSGKTHTKITQGSSLLVPFSQPVLQDSFLSVKSIGLFT